MLNCGAGSVAGRASCVSQPIKQCARCLGSAQRQRRAVVQARATQNQPADVARRTMLSLALVPVGWASLAGRSQAEVKARTDFEPMEALKDKDYGKSRMRYSDYTLSKSGLQYKDLREGTGDSPKPGDVAVIDWDGYTIGYYGRPFEARNKPKGSSFNDDNKDFVRFKVGSNTFIPAFEEAIADMKVGGVRRIIVPVELGYPENNWRSLGPKPSTFTGERALDFVLTNRGMIDKTLLFDIELKNIIREGSSS